MQHFDTEQDAIAFAMPQLVATLKDDLSRMEVDEVLFYTDEDREVMKAKIADIEEIEPRVIVRPAVLPAPTNFDSLASLETVWAALERLPEDALSDDERDDLNTAMAWIKEDLEAEG